MADQKKTDDMSEEELDQIIADMSKEEEEASAAPPVKLVKEARKEAVREAPVGHGQSLTMELTGAINLKLNFASGERSIELHCTEESLLCRMADGTEFRIPTGVAKKRSAA